MKRNPAIKYSPGNTRNLIQARKDFTSVAHKGTPFDPKLLAFANWSKDNLDETLVKIKQAIISGLVKENDKLKKVVKHLSEKNSNEKDHLLGKCRVLWEELVSRDREEDDSTLGGASASGITIAEKVL